MAKAEINMGQAMRHVGLDVTVVQGRGWRLGVWAGTLLIKLAGKLMRLGSTKVENLAAAEAERRGYVLYDELAAAMGFCAEEVSSHAWLCDQARAALNAVVERNSQSKRITTLTGAPVGLKRGDCWCDKGVDNPMLQGHSKACDAAASALHSVRGRKREFLDDWQGREAPRG